MLAGEKKQAPRTMQRRGLDWLFRLVTEPRRLWRRYLSQNPWFKALMVLQVMGSKLKVGHRTSARSEMRG